MSATEVKPAPVKSPEPKSPAPKSPEPPTDVKVANVKKTNITEDVVHVKTTTELSKAVQQLKDKVIVLDFFANWCGPCRIIAPKLLEFQQSYPNVAVIKIDVDESEELTDKYEVSVVPTFVAVKGGDKVETLVGSDIDKIEDLFKKYNS